MAETKPEPVTLRELARDIRRASLYAGLTTAELNTQLELEVRRRDKALMPEHRAFVETICKDLQAEIDHRIIAAEENEDRR